MKLIPVFLTAASFVFKGSAMALTVDGLYSSARSLHEATKFLRRTADNATYDAVINATISATGQQLIQNDINNLTATTTSILKSFDAIGEQLLVIDNQKIANHSFAGPWATLQQTFISHLSDSRNAAANVSAFCQELSNTVGPFVLGTLPGVPAPDPATAVSTLQLFVSEAQELQSEALLVTESFSSLVTSMIDFTAGFAAFADTQQNDTIKIGVLNDDIIAQTAKIAEFRKEINEIGGALGITVFATSSAAAAFPEFAPFILLAGAGAVAGELTGIILLTNELNSAQQTALEDQGQIDTLTQQLAEIAQANSTLLTISNNTIPGMTTQLQAFENIWDAVKADLTQLILYVNSEQSTAQFTPLLAYELLNHDSSPLYTTLAAAMLAYATGIQTNSDVTKVSVAISSPAPISKTAVMIQALLKASKLSTF